MRAGNAIWLGTGGLLRSLRAIMPLSNVRNATGGQPSAGQPPPTSEISDERSRARD